jgi:hypothetical protein
MTKKILIFNQLDRTLHSCWDIRNIYKIYIDMFISQKNRNNRTTMTLILIINIFLFQLSPKMKMRCEYTYFTILIIKIIL